VRTGYSFHVSVPIDRAFAYYCDPRNALGTNSDPRLSISRLPDGPDGNTRYEVTMAPLPDGSEARMTLEYLEMTPPTRIVGVTTGILGLRGPGVTTYRFTPESGGTRVVAEVDLSVGLLGRVNAAINKLTGHNSAVQGEQANQRRVSAIEAWAARNP
jgi:hypothetical protein